jgi:hypothetical protein
MVMRAEVIAALWDGSSKGTAQTIAIARRLNKRLMVWEVPAIPQADK